MSQLIPATNSWGERQSWKSAAIHKTKKTKKRKERERGRGREGEGQKEEDKKRSEDEKGRRCKRGLSRRRLSEVFPEPATAPSATFKQIQHPACSDVKQTNYKTLYEQKPNVVLYREIYHVTFYFLAGQRRPEWRWRWRWRAVVVSRCQTHACQLTNALSTISFSGSRKFGCSPIIPPLVPITWTNKS